MPTQSINAAPSRGTHEPPAAQVARPSAPSRSLVGRLLSALRGDKYMVDAYPPNWQGSSPATAEHQAAAEPPRPGIG